ncbi:MAG TPA: dienelactone hydrolase family protein [Kofleriaceae bacterium]
MAAPNVTRVTLAARDGFELAAYRADPDRAPRGGVVVLHEASGVNPHVRDVADRFAAEGHAVVAPALFDRIEREVELGYDARSFARGIELVRRLDWFRVMLDLEAAVRSVSEAGRVGVVGYCFGGTVAWLAAARVSGIACAVSYYGSKIVDLMHANAPRVPMMLHVGRSDTTLPLPRVYELAALYPAVTIHEYNAGHGFNCDRRADHDATAAALAFARTGTFLRAHVG